MRKEIERDKAKNQLLKHAILLLVLVVAIFSLLNRPHDSLKEGQLQIKTGDKQFAILTMDDLKKLPAVEKKMTINSSRGKTEHQFTCTDLKQVLSSVDSGLTSKYTRITTRGADNYTSGLEMSEVLQPDNVYIAYADDNKPLPTMNGSEGGMRVIIVNDQFGQRFTNYLVSMELQ